MSEQAAPAPNPYFAETGDYQGSRPDYPEASLRAIFAYLGCNAGLDIADIGAGTGKLTVLLRPTQNQVTAVEPAPAMLEQLERAASEKGFATVTGTAENLPLAGASQDLLTYGQCWHWLDAPAATGEANRVLRPGGAVAIIFNQLDVTVPWVHRLSRIMRSGDVHRVGKPPQVEPGFSVPELHLTQWTQQLTGRGIERLGTTRASYIRSDEKGRARMQSNLRWYLYEHLGYQPEQVIDLPYQTLTWLCRRV